MVHDGREVFVRRSGGYSGYSAGNGDLSLVGDAGVRHASPPLNARSSFVPMPCEGAPA